MYHAFPTLYEKDRFWKIFITVDKKSRGFIWTQYGRLDGKETITPPRQIKYKQEITPHKMYQKIYQLAETKWKNKQKLGFSTQKHKNNTPSTIIPMGAQNFTKSSHKINYPAYVQIKYDGYRALTHLGKNTVISRQGKPLKNIEHILTEIKQLGTHPNLYLDGELFLESGIHELKSKLSKNNQTKNDQIRYYIFDLIDTNDMDMPFQERWLKLKKLSHNKKFQYLKLAETYLVNSKEEVEKYLQKFISQGHEGLIVRNLSGPYKLKSKSKNVQKLIEVKRGIFKIVGFKEGSRKQVIWEIECQKSPRKTFWAMPMGTLSYKQKLLQNANQYIGEKIQIKYFAIDKDGCVTRNPVAVMLD